MFNPRLFSILQTIKARGDKLASYGRTQPFHNILCCLNTHTAIIETVASALKMNEVGEEAEDVDEMVISRLHASTQTSNGLLTFSALGEKAKSKSAKYEMVCC